MASGGGLFLMEDYSSRQSQLWPLELHRSTVLLLPTITFSRLKAAAILLVFFTQCKGQRCRRLAHTAVAVAITSVVSDSVQPHRQQPTRLLLSLGFSRQEHWSGLPLPSPMHTCMNAKSLQSCLTLCDPMDSSPPGSSVHRIT